MNVHSGYAKPVLRTAQAHGLVGPDYGWVVTDGTIKDAVRITGSVNLATWPILIDSATAEEFTIFQTGR